MALRGRHLSRFMIAAGLALLSSGLAMPVLAAGHPTGGKVGPGDENRGDIWVDNVGQPGGPGHEMDPHLACFDINLWGAGMGDLAGGYLIYSWPPSGSKTVAYNSTWKYQLPSQQPQVMDVISVSLLIANAEAAGARPINRQGFHFWIDLLRDPQKHKTFWVNCRVSPSPSPTPSPTPTRTPTPTPTATPTPSPTPTPTPTPRPTPTRSVSPSPSPTGSIRPSATPSVPVSPSPTPSARHLPGTGGGPSTAGGTPSDGWWLLAGLGWMLVAAGLAVRRLRPFGMR